MVNEVLIKIPALILLIIANIIAGTCINVLIKKESFAWNIMFVGVLKALISALCVLVLAYAFDIIDLTALGFSPVTIITTGITVYVCKLCIKVVKILGLEKQINISSVEAVVKENKDIIGIE